MVIFFSPGYSFCFLVLFAWRKNTCISVCPWYFFFVVLSLKQLPCPCCGAQVHAVWLLKVEHCLALILWCCILEGSVSPSDWSCFLPKGIKTVSGFYWSFGLCFICWLLKCHVNLQQGIWLNVRTTTTASSVILVFFLQEWLFASLSSVSFLAFQCTQHIFLNQSIYNSVGRLQEAHNTWKYNNDKKSHEVHNTFLQYSSVDKWSMSLCLFWCLQIYFSESFGYLKC